MHGVWLAKFVLFIDSTKQPEREQRHEIEPQYTTNEKTSVGPLLA
jgi:hypothetical protein